MCRWLVVLEGLVVIRLGEGCLVVRLSGGEEFVCSAEMVSAELVGGKGAGLDEELVRGVTAAVLYFFRVEEGREVVSLGEFAAAVRRALAGFGYMVVGVGVEAKVRRVERADIGELVAGVEGGLELAMYERLRSEMRRLLRGAPDELRFCGLRGGVKRVLQARRWSRRCQVLSDQVVGFLRACLGVYGEGNCSMVVRG